MAKAIMVQGTMSNAGKSVLTAALCRIFMQDGFKTAPFKSQNMALNSYITKEGFEMGRAQVMQAEAAGIEPEVCMNPILLKPTSVSGSQVILNGEVIGDMGAREYYTRKEQLVPHILKAYNSLAERFDVIVLEGAGSPAEINLNDVDIVNMGMAELIDCPVLLVGDIDRGGVFASLAGTKMLLKDEWAARIKAFLINKFRGDVEILKPGLGMLTDLTGIPVAGVIPYFALELDDEDSLSERLESRTVTGAVDVAVVRFPRISNFTDFNALDLIPGVSVRYITSVNNFGNPDMIILPGTKNTMGDLKWLRETGIEGRVLRHAGEGGIVFGICGGYQMLGRELSDPHGVEEGGRMRGMSLLDTDTVFESMKTRRQVEGKAVFSGGVFDGIQSPFYGYEIHMGITRPLFESNPVVCIETIAGIEDRKTDGESRGNIYGCYIHGLFDSDEFTRAIASRLFAQKGLSADDVTAFDMRAFKEAQYDALADLVRENIDMDYIYKILNREV